MAECLHCFICSLRSLILLFSSFRPRPKAAAEGEGSRGKTKVSAGRRRFSRQDESSRGKTEVLSFYKSFDLSTRVSIFLQEFRSFYKSSLLGSIFGRFFIDCCLNWDRYGINLGWIRDQFGLVRCRFRPTSCVFEISTAFTFSRFLHMFAKSVLCGEFC